MPKHIFDTDNLKLSEDWVGETIAIICPMPLCGQVFIVNAFIHKCGRKCPRCGETIGYIKGRRENNGTAWVEW